MSTIRIMIADGELSRLRNLSEILGKHEGIEINSTVSTRENAIKESSNAPDVMILNPEVLKDHTLSRFIKSVQSKSPRTKVIHLSQITPADENIISDIKTGIRGFIKSTDSSVVMARAIRAVHEGEIWAERRVLEKALSRPMLLPETLRANVPGLSPLTSREMEMLTLVLQGASNREIADKSSISERTVKTHLYRVYRKLKVKSRTKAIALLSHA